MDTFVSLITPFLPSVLVGLLAATILGVSVLSWFLDLRSVIDTFKTWRKEKVDLKKSLEYLKTVDYFIAHIIHIGGNFSMLYSLFVYSNEEGGYYFNPPKKFVDVGFNRGGDLMIVSASELANKAGFKVDSISSTTGTHYHIQEDKSFCHVSLDNMKNEYQVKFVRSNIEDK